MTKQYVVRDLKSNLFYGAITFSWTDNIQLAYKSSDIQDAERVISQRKKGFYAIDVVYVS